MWRRVASLSPLISSSKPSSLCSAGYGLKIWVSFSTEAPAPLADGADSQEKTPFITFVLGGPGSGKGTQGVKIAETFGFTHLSAGELLRKEMLSTSEYGAMIHDKMRKGKIVPSEVTVKLLQREMESSNNHKFLIDGFPRTEENRMFFLLMQVGTEPNLVLFFDCPEEEMIKRVLNRNQGRVDDRIDIVKKRLKIFQALTLPVIEYYSKIGKLHTINAVGTVDEIFEKVYPIFESCEAIK
ncbi:hypothetical protein K2173_027289 [Erythroxylum novogranatense]|uniref:adenylate kinase n=1 Tax=Erythroxylum novogranatense TaxID=1862640 RepID=A0AAV8TYV2_9ROSI|nr:hypothetical protein K2173_027289 [Erythroxylum novogranatense]